MMRRLTKSARHMQQLALARTEIVAVLRHGRLQDRVQAQHFKRLLQRCVRVLPPGVQVEAQRPPEQMRLLGHEDKGPP